MGAYRELVYGVCFFACAIVGGALGWGAMALAIQMLRPPPNTPADIEMAIAIGAVIGATAGGLTWLVFKRLKMQPSQNH